MSQDLLILEHLKRGPLTALEALNNYGCLRLAARINDLKNKGHLIETKIVTNNGKKFAQYRLLTGKAIQMELVA